MSRPTAALVAGLVALAALAGLAPAADAQPAPPTGSLRLASKTPWVVPGGELLLRLAIATEARPDEVELAVTVYRRVSSRSEFTLTLENRVRGSVISSTATPLSELGTDAGGAVVVRVPVQDPALPGERGRLRLRDEGVYPVRVDLREAGGGTLLARLTTHLVHVLAPVDDARKLALALVLPVHAPHALRPDGSRRLRAQDQQSLSTLARALEAHRDVPVVIRPTPETLEALALSARADDRDTLAILADAAQGREIAGEPYVPIATQRFADAGLEAEEAAQLHRGDDIVRSRLGVRPEPRVAIVEERLDDASLQQLRARHVDRLVVPEQNLAPVELPVTLTQPFELAARQGRRPVALAADPGLATRFVPPLDGEGDAGGRRRDEVLAAHSLLAELAVLYFDRPGRPRGVAVVAPRAWRPTAPFLDTLLDGLASSPVVVPTTLDVLFESVPLATTGSSGAPLIRRFAPPVTASSAALPAGQLRAARRRLAGFASMLPAASTVDDGLEELLLLAQSAELRGRQRLAYLEGLNRKISESLRQIRMPTSRTITLTARRGEIPVTVRNETGLPVTLHIRVDSDKLEFPQGSARTLELARRNTTERFAVEARTSGAFPLRVALVSPDGSLLVGQTRFTVRSTAFSGVGIVLSASALGFLAFWWARHLLRGRRNRRLVPALP